MSDQKFSPHSRTLLAGKIISNYGQSSIDCVVRRVSDHGATVTTDSPLGIPEHCHLLIAGEGPPRPCKRVWQSDKELGLEFEDVTKADPTKADGAAQPARRGDAIVRTQILALRSALDEIETGVVLLDSDLRAQFINHAFRRMWDLPDKVADSRPSYVALMYHGRDTNAYEIASSEMDAYVAERIRSITAGDTRPRDVRRTNGEVIRVQCAVLPDGGRMLSYAFVTDIVRHSDELELLRNALDRISDGVLLLDGDLRVQFLNQKVRDYFGISADDASKHPTYLQLLRNAPHAGKHDVRADKLDEYFASRVEVVRAAAEPVRDQVLHDGRHIRVHSSITASGGRMLTYCDVTDLIRNAKLLEELATIDSLTGLYNRRHFMAAAEAEWARFQRYQRPLSMLMVDIDHFKSVNDRYGHAVGDEAIKFVALACKQDLRGSDMVGRLGGEEFALLLPETDRASAAIVAERIRERVAAQFLSAHKIQFRITISVGLAEASASMSGVDALLRSADLALYQAKDGGRNRVVLWSEPVPPKLAAE